MDSQADILSEIDKKIRLRFLKEKKTSRTYIEGLEKFFNQEEIKLMTNLIKKKLSTGYCTKENEKGDIAHGYNGEHKERIKKILSTEYNVPEDKIILSA